MTTVAVPNGRGAATGASGLTRELAAWAADLSSDAVPSDVRDLARGLLLDALRAIAIGTQTPWGAAVRDVVRGLGGHGTSTVLVFGDRTDPTRAALVNGAFAHAADSDDTHVGSMLHPGAVVVPAALAAAEHVGADGRHLLAAIVAGYEVAIRISLAVQPSHFQRGFQATGTCGVFGATVAASKLLGLDGAGLAGALGAAGSRAGGLAQFYYSGSEVKRVHAGWAAETGVMAALLARAGVSGPEDVLEGQAGFARAYADTFDPSRVTAGLGHEFKLSEVTVKPHGTSARLQATVEAALDLAQLPEVDPAEVEAIDVAIPRVIAGRLTQPDPPDCTAAQMSLPFTVALALVLGRARGRDLPLGVDDYRVHLDDAEVRRLARATTCRVDADVDAATTDALVPSRVTVRLRDGEERQASVDRPRGSPGRPLTADERAAAFRAAASALIPPAALEGTIAAVERIEDQPTVLGITGTFIQGEQRP